MAFVNDKLKAWYGKKREVVTEACDDYEAAIAAEEDPAAKAEEASEEYEMFVTFEDQWLSATSLVPDEWKDDVDLVTVYRQSVCDVVAPMNEHALAMRARCLDLSRDAHATPPSTCTERAPKYEKLCRR